MGGILTGAAASLAPGYKVFRGSGAGTSSTVSTGHVSGVWRHPSRQKCSGAHAQHMEVLNPWLMCAFSVVKDRCGMCGCKKDPLCVHASWLAITLCMVKSLC
jgi:hypothetical protein